MLGLRNHIGQERGFVGMDEGFGKIRTVRSMMRGKGRCGKQRTFTLKLLVAEGKSEGYLWLEEHGIEVPALHV